MNKFLIGVLFIGFTLFIVYFANFVMIDVSQKNEIKNIKVGEKEYILEVVTTSEDLKKGLSKFKNIEDNQGMLFVFDTPGRWSIWMKDMKFNIDIIFLNEKKEVVTLFKNIQFENHENVFEYRKYIPDYDSKYVIELKEGEIQKNKIKVGDIISF
jgi:uncharacterized membrane protein (UPF0127 family)